jgi:hypothetical protein
MYPVGRKYKFTKVTIQVIDDTLHVFDEGGNLIKINKIHAKPTP